MPRKVSLEEALKQIPGPKTRYWPQGEPFSDGMSHGSMSVELFAPRGRDLQQPHEQDELYVVMRGTAKLVHDGMETPVQSGDVLFVPSGETHKFDAMTSDFLTWVIFWGPKGGE